MGRQHERLRHRPSSHRARRHRHRLAFLGVCMSRRKVSFNEAIAKVVATKERDAKRAAMFGELVEALGYALDNSISGPLTDGAREFCSAVYCKSKELQ